jgi:hypothetical protein
MGILRKIIKRLNDGLFGNKTNTGKESDRDQSKARFYFSEAKGEYVWVTEEEVKPAPREEIKITDIGGDYDLESSQKVKLTDPDGDYKIKLYTGIKIHRASEAVSLLMNRALPVAPDISVAEVIQEYEKVRFAWRSKEIFKGSSSKLTKLILQNLKGYECNAHFQSFVVKVYPGQKCAQVEAFIGNHFVGVRLWRSSAVAFVCGNKDFRSDPDSVTSN